MSQKVEQAGAELLSDKFNNIRLIGSNWLVWSDQVDWIKLILIKYSESNWTKEVDDIIFNKRIWPSWSDRVSLTKIVQIKLIRSG